MRTFKKHWATTRFDFSQPTRKPSQPFNSQLPQNTSNFKHICPGIQITHILAQREETREALRQNVSHLVSGTPVLGILSEEKTPVTQKQQIVRSSTSSRHRLLLGVVDPAPGRAQLRRHGAGHGLAEALTPHTAQRHQEHHGIHQSFKTKGTQAFDLKDKLEIRWDGANMNSERFMRSQLQIKMIKIHGNQKTSTTSTLCLGPILTVS